MSVSMFGFKAYNDAVRNFTNTEASIKQGIAPSSKNVSFAQTLDQTLIRDTVDKGEGFGVHLDHMKMATNSIMPNSASNGITDIVSQSLNRVNTLQNEKDEMVVDFASGRTQNVHELMISLQKAGLAMNITSAVRGKVMEAYKELSRMQF